MCVLVRAHVCLLSERGFMKWSYAMLCAGA